ELASLGEALVGDARPQVIEQLLRRLDADVGADERLFELVPRVVVDLGLAQRTDDPGQAGAGLREAIAEPGLDRDGLDDLRLDGRGLFLARCEVVAGGERRRRHGRRSLARLAPLAFELLLDLVEARLLARGAVFLV